jgi:hypothetical protein
MLVRPRVGRRRLTDRLSYPSVRIPHRHPRPSVTTPTQGLHQRESLSGGSHQRNVANELGETDAGAVQQGAAEVRQGLGQGLGAVHSGNRLRRHQASQGRQDKCNTHACKQVQAGSKLNRARKIHAWDTTTETCLLGMRIADREWNALLFAPPRRPSTTSGGAELGY